MFQITTIEEELDEMETVSIQNGINKTFARRLSFQVVARAVKSLPGTAFPHIVMPAQLSLALAAQVSAAQLAHTASTVNVAAVVVARAVTSLPGTACQKKNVNAYVILLKKEKHGVWEYWLKGTKMVQE